SRGRVTSSTGPPADPSEQLVDRGAGLGEMGLGGRAMVLGLRLAALGLASPLLRELPQLVGPTPLPLGPSPQQRHPGAGEREDEEDRGQERGHGAVAQAPAQEAFHRADPSRQDRAPPEESPEVLGHMHGRAVTMGRLLAGSVAGGPIAATAPAG